MRQVRSGQILGGPAIAAAAFGDVAPIMASVDAHVIRFQCPQCGHELAQSIGNLKSNEHMRCPGCGVGINIDTNRLASAAEEIQKAIDKVPPEITIKFFQ
jgi:predicted RNA-binding Zn-ribbon protein involved in translation (DUF1610 family)